MKSLYITVVAVGIAKADDTNPERFPAGQEVADSGRTFQPIFRERFAWARAGSKVGVC